MFEHSNFAEANAIKISPGPRLLMFEHSNFDEASVNQTFDLRASVVWHSQKIYVWEAIAFKHSIAAQNVNGACYTNRLKEGAMKL